MKCDRCNGTGSHYWNSCPVCGGSGQMDDLVHRTKSLNPPDDGKYQWIRFKDGLPNHNTDILVSDGKRVVCAQWNLHIQEGKTYFTTSSNVIGREKELKLFDADITHWMSLPEPPK